MFFFRLFSYVIKPPIFLQNNNPKVNNMRKYLKLIILSLSFFSMFGHINAQASDDLIIEKLSPLGFEETIDKIKSNAKALGWKVPKSWAKNFQKNLKRAAKVDIGRNLVIEMCEPKAAAKLLIHDKYKKFLSMMPCSIAVYEKSDGKVYVSMMNINMLGGMYKGQKEIEELVSNLGPQMTKMMMLK